MTGWIFIVIVWAWIVIFFATGSFRIHEYAKTPKEIYKINNFNMFAAILLWAVTLILNPIFYICTFLYWLMHIGRKD